VSAAACASTATRRVAPQQLSLFFRQHDRGARSGTWRQQLLLTPGGVQSCSARGAAKESNHGMGRHSRQHRNAAGGSHPLGLVDSVGRGCCDGRVDGGSNRHLVFFVVQVLVEEGERSRPLALRLVRPTRRAGLRSLCSCGARRTSRQAVQLLVVQSAPGSGDRWKAATAVGL
jgi:hypothetical protein